ncbi:hypothetical protein KM1_216110 [Entamoeba histolytica HM-3:IMSS]|uniref:Uncharacterized protein n=1 Tax=Entamoeba histolytica HM-3:IMSS TaxID=885315 RepID=M7WVR7_ENTHI|nr:hypothetical protein KM1_216110 [Entamoeba histolytica HM-3:IMSS]
MQTSTNILKHLLNKLSEDINTRLKTNITEEGRSLLYSFAHWAHCLIFIKGFSYDECLYKYLELLYQDLDNFLVNYENLANILTDILYFYKN